MQEKKFNEAANTSRKNRRKRSSQEVLPIIPDKRYFTISEVAYLCAVKPHVLRYWEQEFSQLSPLKRRGNRRYYQYDDVLLVRQIRTLLYENGFTIEGARAKISSGDTKDVSRTIEKDAVVAKLIFDLENILIKLKTE